MSGMTRSEFLGAVGVGSLACITGAQAHEASAEPRSDYRPNIVFVFSDQQRCDTVGAYGQKLPLTPNLDKMAEEGVLFNNAFTCQPVCGPARAVLQTGRYASETGCYRNNIMLPLDAPTLAKNLSAVGYETAYIGKWHLASQGDDASPDNYRTKPVPRERRGGYKDFWLASDVLEFTSHSYDGHMFGTDGEQRDFPPGRYRADVLGDWTLEYLERPKDKPFFLFLSFIEPHHQNDHNRFEGPEGSKERWKDYTVPGDLDGTQGDWRENYPDYLGCIHSVDDNLGRILAKLEDLGIANNTLIIYTSDHGCHFRTRNGEYKRSCHDAAIHIPLVIKGPGFTRRIKVDELVSLVDLPPTILAEAGTFPVAGMRGHPLQQLMDAMNDGWREEVYIEISESQIGRAIRMERWTYAVEAPEGAGLDRPASDRYQETFLYDNQADPHQKNNLVADPAFAPVRDDLRRRLMRHLAETGQGAPEIMAASGV